MILSEIAFIRKNFPQGQEKKRGREEKDVKRDKTVLPCPARKKNIKSSGLMAWSFDLIRSISCTIPLFVQQLSWRGALTPPDVIWIEKKYLSLLDIFPGY